MLSNGIEIHPQSTERFDLRDLRKTKSLLEKRFDSRGRFYWRDGLYGQQIELIHIKNEKILTKESKIVIIIDRYIVLF